VAATRLLLIRRDNIGDLVCTTPLLQALRRQLPQAHIACLVTRYNQAVLQEHPAVDALFAYTKAKHRASGESLAEIYWQRLRMVAALRRQAFDWVILPGGGSASALRFAGWVSAKRILVRDAQDAACGAHEVQQCCHLLARMGLEYEAPATHIVAPAAAARAMRARVREALGFAPRRLIGLHISARKPSQRWPAASFAQLARKLATEGCAYLLLWSPGSADDEQHPGDDAKSAELQQLTRGLPLVALPTERLEDLISGLSLCDALVCGDGGAMHVAAGLGKPIVCLFGQSTAARWHPWGPAYRLLQAPSQEVKDLSVESVAQACTELFAAELK